MERGYIKLWRKTMESQHFSMSLKHIGMFDYLLLKANWKPGYFSGHKIEPGQLATSITHLAETVGEQRHRIKRLLNDLQSCGMINRQNVSNRWVLITVCNWDTYQSNEVAKSPTGVQPESNRVPQSKKDKKDKKKIQLPFSSPEFTETWQAYMEARRAKKQARTDHAQKLLINKMKGFTEAEVINALNAAILSGWPSIYPKHESEQRKLPKGMKRL
jgi:hypothetical protein